MSNEDKVIINAKQNKDRTIDIEVGTSKPKIAPVVQGELAKPTFGKRLKSAIFSTEGDSVKSYVVAEVIVPTIKQVIWDVVTGSMNISMFGRQEPARNIRRNNTGQSYYTSYNQPQRSYYDQGQSRAPQQPQRRVTTPTDFNDIVIPTRGDAEHVLGILGDLMDQYGTVSVSDFYSLLGMSTLSTDNDWGWTDMSSAHVTAVRGGFSIRMPRTQPLSRR